jgi:hypothetical protein
MMEESALFQSEEPDSCGAFWWDRVRTQSTIDVSLRVNRTTIFTLTGEQMN